MARTKLDDVLVSALETQRANLKARIAEIEASPLATLQAELAAVEAKLTEIDPTIGIAAAVTKGDE